MESTSKNRRLVQNKNRDGPEGPIGGFDLVKVELGINKRGKPFYSVVCVPSMTLPYHSCLGGKHVADRIQRLLGLAFLDEPQKPVKNDNGEDDRRVDPTGLASVWCPAPRRTSTRMLLNRARNPHERTSLLALRQAIRPILLEPGRGLGGVEAFFPAGGEPLHGLICGPRCQDTISPAAMALAAAPIIILP